MLFVVPILQRVIAEAESGRKPVVQAGGDAIREPVHGQVRNRAFSLVFLTLAAIKFILRSSKICLTGGQGMAKWEPCWVPLQVSAHILQNLLLWWNFSATLRGCAFFWLTNVATQHDSLNPQSLRYIPSAEQGYWQTPLPVHQVAGQACRPRAGFMPPVLRAAQAEPLSMRHCRVIKADGVL